MGVSTDVRTEVTLNVDSHGNDQWPAGAQQCRGVAGERRSADAALDPVTQVSVAARMTLPRCVVLVPVGGHIEPACESSLRELERRGYPVRRVYGYSAIDQGRNQMASDALADGFEQLMWIDSDIAFDPDDVDRLRQHGLPLVCGIYPKKGQRALAIHVLPGTGKLVFGRGGGLVEIRYAAGGFLLVGREVLLDVQRKLRLPFCNERFERPVVPFFQPTVIPDADGHWYLAEDFAFCERARQCGYRVMADTRIRLRHIGSYPYSWEDAGGDLARYETYDFQLTPVAVDTAEEDLGPAAPGTNSLEPALQALIESHRWPAERPNVPTVLQGWLTPSVRQLLERVVHGRMRLIVELGSWLGVSTRFLARQAPRALVVAVDHWRGSAEHHEQAEFADLLPVLYETFLANCWPWRSRIVPMQMDSSAALQELARRDVRADLIYVDADHSYDAARRDVETAADLFPTAEIVGDDWGWDSVRQAVSDAARDRNWRVHVLGAGWRLRRS